MKVIESHRINHEEYLSQFIIKQYRYSTTWQHKRDTLRTNNNDKNDADYHYYYIHS